MKKAIVVGHTGQDGTYLSRLLTEKQYAVTGISGRAFSSDIPLDIKKINIEEFKEVERVVKAVQPDEIYYLAAVHQSSADKPVEEGELFQKSINVNVKSFVNFLEASRIHAPRTKIFYAASSHIFGNVQASPQDETTPLNPNCIYGITKTTGMRAARYYRENHSLFASVGIFYNHESPLRESKYVSKKIVETAVAIKRGVKSELVLGNLESKIDWGYAPDYMKAVHAMLQLDTPDEFIISSGKIHSIQDFVSGVFARLGLDWKKYVKVDPSLITKKQKQNLFGNNQKIKKAAGWSPGVGFDELIAILVTAETEKQGAK